MPVAQQDAKADLAAWFRKMAEAVAGSAGGSIGVPATHGNAEPPSRPIAPLADMPINPRLPNTPEEEAELQKIAETGGPKAAAPQPPPPLRPRTPSQPSPAAAAHQTIGAGADAGVAGKAGARSSHVLATRTCRSGLGPD